MIEPASGSREVVSFGPFSLDTARRLLTKDGVPVVLGARTLDTLIALLSRPNEAISKRDLLAKVWPDVIVEEGSLRFHIAALRKALGDGQGGARYITTLAGRGYCFVAPISRTAGRTAERATAAASFSHANLPAGLARMVGRDDDIAQLSGRLTTARFVSIVGAGGVGKTTVAVAVGHHLLESFSGAVLFVDLGMLSDPELVPTATASMLGLSVQSDDATPSLLTYLRDKRILLILDTCEHLIEAVAGLASQVFAAAPGAYILATSREALQVDDEYVYRLDPLACPPDDAGLTAAAVQGFPATQLFIERAMASGARLRLSDADAAIVGGICRKLDGVALAIELAARRVEFYGLQQTAALLDQRLTLLWSGPRTATPRQRTLQATLDWSYSLLSDLERLVLRRLAVFVGHFTLDAALEVASSAPIDKSVVLGAMDSLVAKSMVATRPIGAMVRYRLLDTTRAYALDIAIDASELADLNARHAGYYRRWLEQNGNEWSSLSTGVERSAHFAALNNTRAALEWAFGADGNPAIGVRLAAVATPVFLAMSLLPECHRWSERALLALDDDTRGAAEEMHLLACFGTALSYLQALQSQYEAVRQALTKSLAIADRLGDGLNRVGLRSLLHLFHFRSGDYKAALINAAQCREIADTLEDPAVLPVAHSVLGRSLHMAGQQDAARVELDYMMAERSHTRRASTIYLGYDRNYRAEIALARTVWLQGYPDQAAAQAQATVKEAERLDRPEALSVVLAWAASVFLWTGDLARAEEVATASIFHARSQSLHPLIVLGQASAGALAIRRGDSVSGVASLKALLEKAEVMHNSFLATEFRTSLVQGLATLGRDSEGRGLVDETLRMVEIRGDRVYLPELLRLKAGFLPDGEAEGCLRQSLDVSRSQGARSWQLRAATDLALLLSARGRSDEARALLQPVFAGFTEGHDTPDLKAAHRLLEELH